MLRLPIGLGASIAFSVTCAAPAEHEARHPPEGQKEEVPHRCVVPDTMLDTIERDTR